MTGLMLNLCALFSQEDKEAMFDVYDTLTGVLQVATGVVSTLHVNLRMPFLKMQ